MTAEFEWDMDKDLISKLGNHLDSFLAYLHTLAPVRFEKIQNVHVTF